MVLKQFDDLLEKILIKATLISFILALINGETNLMPFLEPSVRYICTHMLCLIFLWTVILGKEPISLIGSHLNNNNNSHNDVKLWNYILSIEAVHYELNEFFCNLWWITFVQWCMTSYVTGKVLASG